MMTMMLVRHLVSIAALPFTVAVVIPIWIARRSHVAVALPADPGAAALSAAGGVLFLVGLWLFCWSLYLFWSRGKGTLAPWDPPRAFVAEGPYRFVRNPMISGVVFVLFAEAALLRSWPHAGWALLFLAINAVYIPLVEEPMLAERFGEPYVQYKRAVRRFLPRIHV
jgi:protein-S-isoprenylcysteine O-methyltransferase Ste14